MIKYKHQYHHRTHQTDVCVSFLIFWMIFLHEDIVQVVVVVFVAVVVHHGIDVVLHYE
jgi:hypothetical protein